MNANAAVRDSGFTLVETLVSLAILALAFAVMIPIFLESGTHSERAKSTRVALAIAESKLDEARAIGLPELDATEGHEGAFRWVVRVTPVPELSRQGTLAVDVSRIEVAVSWGTDSADGNVSIETLRIDAGRQQR
jgi:prepilin-type N-terminal cleavage/methylation domain-containing protein